MPKPKRHIFVCRNYRDADSGKHSCEARGAAEIFEAFKNLRKEAGIAEETKLTKVQCFGKCMHGPNVVIYPDNVWYCGLKAVDIKEIAEEHLINNRPVTGKCMPDDLI
ncbi:MAG: (2Fe-2S) ferredoxin domain-containing protein [candidate division Zixibacteria bacterium]